MPINAASYAAYFKQRYDGQTIKSLMYQNHPFLAMVPKANDFTGDSAYPLPLAYSSPQGFSSTFGTAQANQTFSGATKFQIFRATEYGLLTISRETMLASGDDLGAFAKARDWSVKALLNESGNRFDRKLIGNTAGVIGRLSSTSGVTTTWTLANRAQVTAFEVGQTLRASTAADGTGLKIGSALVTAVDRNLGTITVGTSGALFTPVLAVSDYLYIDGDAGVSFAGLDSWIPLSVPSATPFFGVDRTTDIQRLSGVRYDARGIPLKEAINNMNALLDTAGSQWDKMLMHPDVQAQLENSLGTQSRYEMTKSISDPEISLRMPVLSTGRGEAPIIVNRYMPKDRIYFLQLGTWTFKTLGGIAATVDEDVEMMLRVSNADAFEIRFATYGNLMCNAPGWNGVMQIA